MKDSIKPISAIINPEKWSQLGATEVQTRAIDREYRAYQGSFATNYGPAIRDAQQRFANQVALVMRDIGLLRF